MKGTTMLLEGIPPILTQTVEKIGLTHGSTIDLAELLVDTAASKSDEASLSVAAGQVVTSV